MRYSYEFKKKCVEMYKQGKYPDTPSGISCSGQVLQKHLTTTVLMHKYFKNITLNENIAQKNKIK